MASPPERCPLCGKPNSCGIASGSKECWCFGIEIPVDVLARAAAEAEGKSCLCPACAAKSSSIRRSEDAIQS